jgi:uncharacterized protein
MRLNVNRILHTPGSEKPFSFELDLSQLEFNGGYPVSEPVIVEGRVRNEAGMLILSLRAHTTLHCVCDRCATEFLREKDVPYECYLAQEIANEESDDIVLLENDEVDLGAIAEEAFILEMDTRILCSEDCKGLCFRCGANLNFGPCQCKKEVDPRLAALAKLLSDDGE